MKNKLHRIRKIMAAFCCVVLLVGCGENTDKTVDKIAEESGITTGIGDVVKNTDTNEKVEEEASSDERSAIDSDVNTTADEKDNNQEYSDSAVEVAVSGDNSAPSEENIQDGTEEKYAETGQNSQDSSYVDLTALSSTMVYAEVYQMMYYPENYEGKKVKMEGLYDAYHDENTGKDYYACIITDATACCAQGIEFILSDGNYPSSDTMDVTVEGTFTTYEEDGAKYCTLKDAVLCE